MHENDHYIVLLLDVCNPRFWPMYFFLILATVLESWHTKRTKGINYPYSDHRSYICEEKQDQLVLNQTHHSMKHSCFYMSLLSHKVPLVYSLSLFWPDPVYSTHRWEVHPSGEITSSIPPKQSPHPLLFLSHTHAHTLSPPSLHVATRKDPSVHLPAFLLMKRPFSHK